MVKLYYQMTGRNFYSGETPKIIVDWFMVWSFHKQKSFDFDSNEESSFDSNLYIRYLGVVERMIFIFFHLFYSNSI